MSQLICPLCGRFVGIEHFDLRLFEADTIGVEVFGISKGKGFGVTDRYSLLDDPKITDLRVCVFINCFMMVGLRCFFIYLLCGIVDGH